MDFRQSQQFATGSRRGLVTDQAFLDVRHLVKSPGWQTGAHLNVIWRWPNGRTRSAALQINENSITIEPDFLSGRSQTANLTSTECHFGGRRLWFVCPNIRCGRRAAILYGGPYFYCRECHGLAYPSENETGHARSLRRIRDLRAALGWSSMSHPTDARRPRYMCRRRYLELMSAYTQELEDHNEMFRNALGGRQ